VRLTLEDISLRLGKDVPAEYASFVRLKGIDSLHDSLAAPAEICARNLEEHALNETGPTSCGFVLCERGNGDSFVLPHDADDGLARVWSHETHGLIDTAVRAIDLLEELAATPIPDVTSESGDYVLSRVTPASQAILNPVTPAELQNAARALPGLAYFDQLEMENPFTNELVQFNVSGLALSGREARLELTSGALVTRGLGSEDLDQLAKVAEYLGCLVFPRLPRSVTANNRWRGP